MSLIEKILIKVSISSRIFDDVIAKWTFLRPSPKLRVQPLLFLLFLLSFSSLFLFLLSFPFVTVILELFGLKKLSF